MPTPAIPSPVPLLASRETEMLMANATIPLFIRHSKWPKQPTSGQSWAAAENIKTMQWILLSLASACLLGIYDLLKKSAVRNNAVPPVLLLSVLTAAIIYAPVVLVNSCFYAMVQGTAMELDELGWLNHARLCLKSILVGASWTMAFFALKHLPISIATPIRSTSPFWTIMIAVTAFGESPTWTQWIGMLVLVVAFAVFSTTGRTEGVHFARNGWVALMVAATLLGSISALYDKYLLQTCRLTPITVQAWFSIYLVPVMLPLALRWYLTERQAKPFQWRASIHLLTAALLLADILYFSAVSHPQAMISIISPVRRTSVIIPFVFGIVYLGEKNWRSKAICVGLMLLGVFLVSRQS